MSNLRNSRVPCHYFYYFHVDFKMCPCCMSILRNSICHIVYDFPHFDFKKWPCRRVEFRSQGSKDIRGDVKIQLPRPSVCRSQSPLAVTGGLNNYIQN